MTIREGFDSVDISKAIRDEVRREQEQTADEAARGQAQDVRGTSRLAAHKGERAARKDRAVRHRKIARQSRSRNRR